MWWSTSPRNRQRFGLETQVAVERVRNCGMVVAEPRMGHRSLFLPSITHGSMYASRFPLLLSLALIGSASTRTGEDVEDITSQTILSLERKDSSWITDDTQRDAAVATDGTGKSKEKHNFSNPSRHTQPSKRVSFYQSFVKDKMPQQPMFQHTISSISIGSAYNNPKARAALVKTGRNVGENRMVVAGIPDINDPCFRRYANTIIVNAQPYERRSTISLLHCKTHCLHSQSGVYTCRSFVFDNIDQVCDLFSHVGDQFPARLMKFQTRDYFEPTHSTQCLLVLVDNTTVATTSAATTTSLSTTATEPAATTSERLAVIRASKSDQRVDSEDIVRTTINDDLAEQKQSELTADSMMVCPTGKRISFLRTEGFELYKNDDMTMHVSGVDECVLSCERNYVAGQALDCRSFDFTSPMCSFSSETAVPVGNGQLQQRNDSYYYEKICVADSPARSCPPTFSRFPQMVLVGFAEGVSDASSFEECFEHCLNSHRTYGFNCTSGMYFFEEVHLNCILNTENRHTQSELFTEENGDIVDYFEIGCEEERTTLPTITRQHRAKAAKTYVARNPVIPLETQTTWSPCKDGHQRRPRDCSGSKDCSDPQIRPCQEDDREIKSTPIAQDNSGLPTQEEIASVKAQVRDHGLPCAPNVCCAVFEQQCSIGLRLNSRMKRLEWCKRPCRQKRRHKDF